MQPQESSAVKELFLIKSGALDQIRDAIIATDDQDRLTYLNKAASVYYGIDQKKALGSKVNELYKQIWFTPEEEHQATIALKNKGFWQGINIQLRPDGEKTVIESAINVLKDEAGNRAGLLSVMRDITQRVDVDQWLFESNQRLKYVIKASGMMVYEINLKSKEILIIRGLERLLGYTIGEVPPTVDWWISQIHPDDRHRAQEQFYPKDTVEKVVNEYRILSKGGDYIVVQGVARILRDKDGNASRIVGGMQDITKLLEMEASLSEKDKQLHDAQRMAVIGQVSAMVGHDIRNPLQAISSDVFLLKDYLKSAPELPVKKDVAESLDGIEKNIEYINKIVADLQDYARVITAAAQEVDLQAICEEVLLKNGVPANVKVSYRIEESAKVLISDAALLRRILANLTSNAVQAMPNGGELSVNVVKDQGDIVISVEDTGTGIPKDIKDKLFTPMFTTKAKGQGFGLAVVKRMTEALGGEVTYESEVGKGTSFIVRLPPLPKK